MTQTAKQFFDEMQGYGGNIRAIYQAYNRWLANVPTQQLAAKRAEAEVLFRRVGITFNVYGEEDGAERLIPFDVIPRMISASEWAHLSKGAVQRVRALNMFLHDIYHDQEIIKAGIVPHSILTNAQYRPEMVGVNVPNQVYAHVAGIDLVRTSESQFYVLEDNLRTPSGVSYMLEDRKMMMRLFPDLFKKYPIAPVEHYPSVLLNNLRSVAQTGVTDPTVVLLSPGAYNSAYFEHAFLDQLVFKPDSLLGVPGLLSVYRNGGVTLANAVGTGVADDKATYIYVPEMIKFYLGESPILQNVPTYQLSKEDDLAYVLDHLPELVVKEVQGSGGYGMLVGPTASKQEIEEFRLRIVSKPANYIAQPTLALSTCPTLVDQGIAPRHVDLRPFVLSGKTVSVVPGGLSRVALKEGSLVVNSSQGGGTKDTWVLERDDVSVETTQSQMAAQQATQEAVIC